VRLPAFNYSSPLEGLWPTRQQQQQQQQQQHGIQLIMQTKSNLPSPLILPPSGRKTPEYKLWLHLLQAGTEYPAMRLSDEWGSYEAFLFDVGGKGHSSLHLGRIDLRRPYEFDNTVWTEGPVELADSVFSVAVYHQRGALTFETVHHRPPAAVMGIVQFRQMYPGHETQSASEAHALSSWAKSKAKEQAALRAAANLNPIEKQPVVRAKPERVFANAVEAEQQAFLDMQEQFEADPRLERECRSKLSPEESWTVLEHLKKVGYTDPDAVLNGTPEYKVAAKASLAERLGKVVK
jgi:hypothetical protein